MNIGTFGNSPKPPYLEVEIVFEQSKNCMTIVKICSVLLSNISFRLFGIPPIFSRSRFLSENFEPLLKRMQMSTSLQLCMCRLLLFLILPMNVNFMTAESSLVPSSFA